MALVRLSAPLAGVLVDMTVQFDRGQIGGRLDQVRHARQALQLEDELAGRRLGRRHNE